MTLNNLIDELHPIVQKKTRCLIQIADKNGVQIRILSTYRNQQEQDLLYEKGRVSPGRIMTNHQYPYSFHNHRVALQVVPIVDGRAKWDDLELWCKLGEWGKSIGFTWGGDYLAFPDKTYFHYTQGLSIIDFIGGKDLEPECVEIDCANSNQLEYVEHVLDKISTYTNDSWMKACKKGVIPKGMIQQDPLTREELMVFLDRVGVLDMSKNNTNNNNNIMHDNYLLNVDVWAKKSWRKAINKCVITEKRDPKGLVTIEELMVYFDRLGVV